MANSSCNDDYGRGIYRFWIDDASIWTSVTRWEGNVETADNFRNMRI